MADEIIPRIRQVADEFDIPTINLHRAMGGRSEWFPDHIHPNAVGAAMMAQVICYELVQQQ